MTGALDGDVDFETVPQGVVSVSTRRGRDKDVGRTSAGSLSLGLRNEDRFFDPLVGDFALYASQVAGEGAGGGDCDFHGLC
jgi:hypothetical protein